MDPQVAVPLYLTILMAVLVAIAVFGGRAADKRKAEGQKKDK
jgi:hypothetical protein